MMLPFTSTVTEMNSAKHTIAFVRLYGISPMLTYCRAKRIALIYMRNPDFFGVVFAPNNRREQQKDAHHLVCMKVDLQ